MCQANRRENMRKTKEDALKTRENILNAATDLFSTKGVEATSLLEIANHADVTRGAIYWHFKNKCEIFEALHERMHQNFIQIVMEDLETDHPQPLKQMEAVCSRLLTSLDDDILKRQALTLFLMKCNYIGEFSDFVAKQKQCKTQAMMLLKQYLERAQKKGLLPADSDIDILMTSINCYLKGVLIIYLSDPDDFDIKDMAPKLMRLFFSKLA